MVRLHTENQLPRLPRSASKVWYIVFKEAQMFPFGRYRGLIKDATLLSHKGNSCDRNLASCWKITLNLAKFEKREQLWGKHGIRKNHEWSLNELYMNTHVYLLQVCHWYLSTVITNLNIHWYVWELPSTRDFFRGA